MSTEDKDLPARLQAIDERLARLERSVFGPQLRAQPPAAAAPAPPAVPRQAAQPAPPAAGPARTAPAAARGAPLPLPSAYAWPPAPVGAAAPVPRRPAPGEQSDLAITNILGWSGAVALVLAAAYLIRLAIDAGWLTPTVQVGAAALFGVALIIAGFALSRISERYAGLLPAAGIVVLFLSVYGAHLLYHLMDANAASVAVMVVCAASIGLCIAFDSDLYALFAVAGSYSAPFLLARGGGASAGDLALYYSAWSLTFTVLAILRGRRVIYLLALYVALVGFDALARPHHLDWRTVLEFQTMQFLIFGTGAVVLTIRRGEPMDETIAVAHLPALVLFYALQYLVLRSHLPQAAPWIAIGTLLAVALLYVIVRVALKRSSPGGQLLLGSYAALVLFHAGYLESVPSAAAPWVAVAVVGAVLALRRRWGSAGSGLTPLLIAVGAIFVINLLRALTGAAMQTVPAHQLLAPIYAALLYLGYALTRREPSQSRFSAVLLYAGHLTAMSAIVQLIHEPILQSVTWGLLALGSLAWSLSERERLLGQSSLLLFGTTAAKVMLFDLAGAAPLARIVSLFVLGITFYVAGLLYRRMSQAAEPRSPRAGERPLPGSGTAQLSTSGTVQR